MSTDQEYFAVDLTGEITLGLSLSEMVTVAQFKITDICVVPGVADFWYGVVNFKGCLLWILDSALFFQVAQKPAEKLTVLVIKNQLLNNKQVAITVQQLKGIVTISPSNFKSLNQPASQLHQCCSTAATVDGQTINLIDSASLLQQLNSESMLVFN